MLRCRRIDPLLNRGPLPVEPRLTERGIVRKKRCYDDDITLLLGADKSGLTHFAASAAGHRLIIVTWFPVGLNVTSSMKVRIKSSPRPLTRSRFSGSVGSGSFAGSNPGP